MSKNYSLPPAHALAPELIALDARVQLMREGDPLPAGTYAVVFRFATADVSPLALAVATTDLRDALVPIERALAAQTWPETREVLDRQERWGTVEYQPDRPSWVTSGAAAEFTSADCPVGEVVGVNAAAVSAESWILTLHTAAGLPCSYLARLGLVEELWDLLYERWQDLDPEAGLFV